MARNTVPHSSTFDFPVALEPLHTMDGRDSGLFGTVSRDQTGVRVFGSASERYGLLLNSTFVEQIEDGIAKAGLSGFEREAFVYDNGARSEFRWTFKNRTIKVPQVGDDMAFRITARNSYDGTWKASLLDSVMRLANNAIWLLSTVSSILFTSSPSILLRTLCTISSRDIFIIKPLQK